MIAKRFPPGRRWRILGWTSVAIAWATVGVTKGLAVPVDQPESVAAPAPPAPVIAQPSVVAAPTPPADGLVVLRYMPAATPDPEVRRVVVTRAAPAPAATSVTSSGS